MCLNSNANGNGAYGLIAATGQGSEVNPVQTYADIKPVDLNKLVAKPDVLPACTGGITGLLNFLERNLNTPCQILSD